MERPTCKTCPYWGEGGGRENNCTRLPPRVVPQMFRCEQEADRLILDTGVWPTTIASEGCGEHPDFPAYIASLRVHP